MTKPQRILIASHRPTTAWRMRQQLAQLGRWLLVGIVDPRIEDAVELLCEKGDVVLIEARELIWLLNHRPAQIRESLRTVRPVILLQEDQVLEVVTHCEPAWGLLLEGPHVSFPLERLELAASGYMIMSEQLYNDLITDNLRLDIVPTLTSLQLSILSYLGMALSNREIAERSGLKENRVRTLIQSINRKLCLRNRTAVAVFAAENGFVLPLSVE